MYLSIWLYVQTFTSQAFTSQRFLFNKCRRNILKICWCFDDVAFFKMTLGNVTPFETLFTFVTRHSISWYRLENPWLFYLLVPCFYFLRCLAVIDPLFLFSDVLYLLVPFFYFQMSCIYWYPVSIFRYLVLTGALFLFTDILYLLMPCFYFQMSCLNWCLVSIFRCLVIIGTLFPFSVFTGALFLFSDVLYLLMPCFYFQMHPMLLFSGVFY